MSGDCALIVFAKAPVPGCVKTRLVGALGAEGAARLALRMLLDTVGRAVDAGVGPVELCCAPDDAHPEFRRLATHYPIRPATQGDGDLGARMHRALARNLCQYPRALLIGADAPGLGATHIRQAARALQSTPAVFVPASDGGYVLVGLSRPMPALFAGIAWSSERVMAQTRERLVRIGVAHAELGMVDDVDEPADLRHVPARWLE